MRQKKYFYSIVSSLCSQFVSIICGIILPWILIQQYGSELYGATTSITQFLGYITLLEGGIGGVARAALYKPLANKDCIEINKVVSYIQKFFRVIAIFFVVYSLIIAGTYRFIAKDNTLDGLYSFILVIVIALSSMAQYYFGIAYSILLQADQKSYITGMLGTCTLLFNTIFACVLAFTGADMIVLKLAWCCVHFVRIGILNWYIYKVYALKKIKVSSNYLPQKWEGMGQHIAYFLHSHTDVIVLTILIGLNEVSVYSIYNYIFVSLTTIVLALGANMEAVFGDMLAKNETESLYGFFEHISFLLNNAVIICFSVASLLIIPFVKLYTSGIYDANYIRPGLAFVMMITQIVYCLRQPYHQIIIAAGKFKETRNAAYIEAILNIGLSIFFAIIWGTEGVVVATFISMVYRALYFIFYLKYHILYYSFKICIKRFLISSMNMVINIYGLNLLINVLNLNLNSASGWIFSAIILVFWATIITLIFSFFFYRNELYYLARRMMKIKLYSNSVK